MGAKSGRNKRGAKKASAPKASRRSGGSNGAQRLGLVLFAVVFVALFVIFVVADGLGAPSVPSGDIALVTNVPGEAGHISESAYKKSLAQKEKEAGLKKPPKAGSKKAEEINKSAIGELLQVAWIAGEGEELGIKVTNKEIETELAKVKKESFKTEKAFQEFLKESELTAEEVNARIELQILSKKIQEKITNEAPPVTEAEQEEYYEAEKATQYTKKPTRDVRVVVNENKKEVEEAQKALEADNSAKSWEKVTKKYSPTTATNGGLQKEISEEFLTGPLKKDIFGGKVGELVGPVKQEKNYLLIEVVKTHPEKVQTFAEVKTTIATTLGEERQQTYFSEWVSGFQSKWTSRTHCASGFTTEQCVNYVGTGHPAAAPAACYEAAPKTPTSECPAPVTQTTPAVPGTVTRKTPKGEQLVQRPRPYTPAKAKGKAAEEAVEGATGTEGTSPEQEAAAQKAVEEAAAQAAAEQEAGAGAEAEESSGAGQESGGKSGGKKSGK